MIRMPGQSFSGPLPPLTPDEQGTRARLEAHVTRLAGTIGERNYLRPAALDAAATYVATSLEALGYEIAAQPFSANGLTVRNIEAMLPGHGRPEEIVVVGGHYDSVVGTPGAD